MMSNDQQVQEDVAGVLTEIGDQKEGEDQPESKAQGTTWVEIGSLEFTKINQEMQHVRCYRNVRNPFILILA